MNRGQRILLVGAFTTLCAVAAWFLLSRFGLAPGDRDFEAAFSRIAMNMQEEDVVRLLGEPSSRSSNFRLGQYKGNELQYAAARRSGCREFLTWNRGIDVKYVVGVDSGRRVCLVVRGGT